jgi:hypothetical protein
MKKEWDGLVLTESSHFGLFKGKEAQHHRILPAQPGPLRQKKSPAIRKGTLVILYHTSYL